MTAGTRRGTFALVADHTTVRFDRGSHDSLHGGTFIDALLDDDFRALLTNDPAIALGQYGIDVSRDLLPAELELPTKEEIEAAFRGGLPPSGPRIPYMACLCWSLAYGYGANHPYEDPPAPA